jgi:hypothetical protein
MQGIVPSRKMVTGEKNLIQYVASTIQDRMEFILPAREVTMIRPFKGEEI